MSGILVAAMAYAAVGVLFSGAFIARGLTKVDPKALGGTWAFRLMILPGVVALWPVLVLKWRRASASGIHR